MPVYHKPVMEAEVLGVLEPSPGKVIIDGTVGEGGHSRLIGPRIKPGGLLIGIDRDRLVLEEARRRIEETGSDFRLYHGSYSRMRGFLSESGKEKADGVLLDLGFSMRHIRASGRGFSFMKDEVLDMRYDTSSGVPAYRWLSEAEERDIRDVIRKYGQDKRASRIAKEIKKEADKGPVMTSRRLAAAVSRAVKSRTRRNPATRTFQALRIHVNRELDELETGLREALLSLEKGGVLAVITYHSLEDRAVKRFMAGYTGRCRCPSGIPECRCSASDKVPLVSFPGVSGSAPDAGEISENPSARSARLRVCRIETPWVAG